ncbi:MAG: class I SAM-dependent methyltransferase [Xanthobacteraceae bacterium]|nr:class I SAM-dependent methyltransferase [Xanthobacteraceae bacterium]
MRDLHAERRGCALSRTDATASRSRKIRDEGARLGLGRGDYVAWLRRAGYDAYGAEIRQAAFDRGKELFRTLGFDHDRVIRPITPDCKTDLPAGAFHFVFTHYVLEHVADIDAVTAEMARVTTPGGCGFHVYPGKLRPIEPHLFMPSYTGCRRTSPASG